jgi:hypothetical protein
MTKQVPEKFNILGEGGSSEKKLIIDPIAEAKQQLEIIKQTYSIEIEEVKEEIRRRPSEPEVEEPIEEKQEELTEEPELDSEEPNEDLNEDSEEEIE